MKVFCQHPVVVVNGQGVDAVQKHEISLVVHGSKRVQRSQHDALQHDGAVDERDVGVGDIGPPQNTRGDEVKKMDTRDVNTDGLERLNDLHRASTCRNVDTSHLKHLHERNHGAGGDGKGIRRTHAHLDGTSKGDLRELFGDALIKFEHV